MKATITHNDHGFTFDYRQWRSYGEMCVKAGYASNGLDDTATQVGDRYYWPTREEAIHAFIESAYPRYVWPGGYHTYAVGDGFLLCNDCATKEATDALMESDRADDLADLVIAQGDEGHEGDDICDQCNAVINPATCYECYDPMYAEETGGYAPNSAATTGLPDFRGDHGYYQIHGHCLAQLVQKGDAHKAGKQSYQIHAERNQTFTTS